MSSNLKQISFHDPEGHVFEIDGRLLRKVSLQATSRLIKFLSSQIATDLVEEKLIPKTRELSADELSVIGIDIGASDYVWFEHERINFVSYPCEWIPEMLLAAAEFTLSLVKRLNAEGWDLKDASANNVVFDGSRPVFIDLCSIVEGSNEPYWWPKGQFERHFILPLMAYVYRGLPPNHIHFSNADGLEPQALSSLIGIKRWTSTLSIKHCALPVLLSTIKQSKRQQGLDHIDPIASAVAKKWQVGSLERTLTDIKRKLPKPASGWHAYAKAREHYIPSSLVEKRETVERWIEASTPMTVLDLGANTGEFSILASRLATRVLAFEKDLDAARLAYLNTKDEHTNCHIILQDLGNPTPAMGWRHTEKKSINQRMPGEVECVLALALIHHWLVSAGIPLGEILFQLAQWTKRFAIIEYISPTDPMFELICTQRKVDFSWLELAQFRQQLGMHFTVIEEFQIKDSQRTLFYCERSR